MVMHDNSKVIILNKLVGVVPVVCLEVLEVDELVEGREVHVDYAALGLVAGPLGVADWPLELPGLVDDKDPGPRYPDGLVGHDVVWSVAVSREEGSVADEQATKSCQTADFEDFWLSIYYLFLEGPEIEFLN